MPTAAVVHNSGAGAELGHLHDWLTLRGFDVTMLERDRDLVADADRARAAADAADLLILLGSRWSVARPMDRIDDEPYAAAAIAIETDLTERRVAQDRPLLGICFGAQLLCRVLGGSVTPLHEKVFGWIEPRSDESALTRSWYFGHEDRFVPPAYVRTTAVADHAQVAFRHGRAWGLQFHPEVDAHTLRTWFDELGMDRARVGDHIVQVLTRREANRADAHALFDHIWQQASSDLHEPSGAAVR
ncbi:type 1 glutamine amidotransferase [Nocardioides sp. Iso805N]|uniref:type 1 glutamine amidotransferase n=1 Tax=Nocardioides sp. Iso805N TaxID=1283287 RepID=UPI00036F01C2|nr:gamma-glutamyl-gamma-aminobutyrate hydrolase family protein [Nocardioides sp. Iso805N]